MKFGFVFPGGEARIAAEFGREAEAAGWDGFFVPDAVWWHDPWVTLAAVAMVTERIRIGTMLTPVSRRRPWKLASETATLDRLSNGRLILSVGLGAPDTGFEAFGEETDRKMRAEMLDEGLQILAGLWQGQPFRFTGKHYRIQETTFPAPPPPRQSPRIPIWVVGAWPRLKSMQRAAHWDGLLPNKLNSQGQHETITPQDIHEMKEYIQGQRQRLFGNEQAPFDIVMEGSTPGEDPKRAREIVLPFAAAGATWWLEAMWQASDLDEVAARIRLGPVDLG